MNCPLCTDRELVMAERSGIEIDYCPGCRGIWLDRGELDKLIARDAARAAPADEEPAVWRDDNDDDERPQGGRRGRRESLLDLFDFG